MRKKGKCERCYGTVASGGNLHGKGKCNMRGPFWQRRRKTKKKAEVLPVRGVAVAGTGKPSASSDKKAGVKKEGVVVG